MNANEIKQKLIKFYKTERGADVVATEVEYMDFVAVFQHHIFEVEIKTSISDFKNDFDKHKHYEYFCGINHNDNIDRHIPNKFYYAVTPDIKDEVLKILEEKSKDYFIGKYGVICLNEINNLYVLKSAKRLHEKFSQGIQREAVKRITTEYLYKMDLYNSITKEQRNYKRVFDKMKIIIDNTQSCKRCRIKENLNGYCCFINEYIKPDEFKKRCNYLFKEGEQDA